MFNRTAVLGTFDRLQLVVSVGRFGLKLNLSKLLKYVVFQDWWSLVAVVYHNKFYVAPPNTGGLSLDACSSYEIQYSIFQVEHCMK